MTVDREAELDEMVAICSAAGLVETFVDVDGKPALRLTERGAQVGRALAMGGDTTDAEAVLDGLLVGATLGTSRRGPPQSGTGHSAAGANGYSPTGDGRSAGGRSPP